MAKNLPVYDASGKLVEVRKPVEKITFLYCYASGQAYFGYKVPKGAIVIDQRTQKEIKEEKKLAKAEGALWESDPNKNPLPRTIWRNRMTARMRMAYDGVTMLVPGLPEAKNDREREVALARFIAWAVKKGEQ